MFLIRSEIVCERLGMTNEFHPAAPEYGAGVGVGIVLLDDCNFHESVRLDDFESERALTLVPRHVAYSESMRWFRVQLKNDCDHKYRLTHLARCSAQF